jgi:transposase
VSRLDLTLDPERFVRRVELINGIGGRRRWSTDDKARIVEETLAPGAVVSEVARRYGLSPQQVFGWRRQARHPLVMNSEEEAAAPSFVPALVETSAAAPVSGDRVGKPPRRPGRSSGMIELELDGVTVRVGRGAEAKTIAAVIRALKSSA